MLYSEFLENTKARDNEYNYQVYKNLEALYMENDNLTKADIYKAAKILVNDEQSEATKELIAQAEHEIKESQEMIEYYKGRIDTYTEFIIISDPEEAKLYKDSIKEYKRQIKKEQSWIARNKFFLNGIA